MEIKKENTNDLSGSHTDLPSLMAICSRRTISSEKKKQKKNVFKFDLFHTPHN